MDNLKSDTLQLIIDIELIFNNEIVEGKVYNDYFYPGTRFLNFYNKFSTNYDYLSTTIVYTNLNDPHYWYMEL